MLTLIFICLMIAVFGKLVWFAIRAAWGITKVLFTIIFLPVILIALFVGGFAYVALIGLLIVGALSLVKTI
ncbi:MAG: hypothetical protein SO172_04885 [Pararoseburia sp.]|nr:hypothetical protein [Pararoseburia sp.]